MSQYEDGRKWSDQYNPDIKLCLLPYLGDVDEATPEEDMQRNTDMMATVGGRLVRVSCRVRDHKYLKKYGEEFTIRDQCDYSEFVKIQDGWGDFLFYGFAAPPEDGLWVARWSLICLEKFRAYVAQHIQRNAGQLPGRQMWNRTPDENQFRVFKLCDMPEGSVVDQSGVALDSCTRPAWPGGCFSSGLHKQPQPVRTR